MLVLMPQTVWVCTQAAISGRLSISISTTAVFWMDNSQSNGTPEWIRKLNDVIENARNGEDREIVVAIGGGGETHAK